MGFLPTVFKVSIIAIILDRRKKIKKNKIIQKGIKKQI